MLKLYIADHASIPHVGCSPPSWMVHLALAEKGIAHSVERLDFASGAHRTPAMLALNPRGTVPVLTDGRAVVYETFAILEYIEFAHPVPALMPAGVRARACALTRLHEVSTVKSLGMAWFGRLMRGEPTDDAKAAFFAELRHWNAYLDGNTWVAGTRLTLADLAVFAYLATGVQARISLDGLPHLAAFYTRMRRRSSVRVTWPQPWSVSA